MSVPLLFTKLYIPSTRPNLVTRPRLIEKLLNNVSHSGSFSLISGPAGFGKTTLLSEFVGRLQRPAAWVSLDEGDNDPIRFWTYLITACQAVQEGIGERAMALFHTLQSLPGDAIPTILINDLAKLDHDLVLVLDDYHVIQNETIHSAISFLLEHLPGKLHIVVSTRVDPPWPLARFRARNQMVELRAQDLRFTTKEATSFLNHTMGLNLSAEDVAALEERTEGWIAGLQLAALSMQERNDIAAFVRAFTGSHVYVAEYLVEEVLKRQPADMQSFLLQTSILERLNGGLCDAITDRRDGQTVLTALHKANLFVISLDDNAQWFRYHQLFADLLRARLRQSMPADAVVTLHQRAATWYEQAGMMNEAIEHTLAAGDYSHAVQLVEKIAMPMILKAYFKTVEDWLQAIPPEYLNESPRANMAFAWMHLMRRNFSQAIPFLERLRQIFHGLKREELGPSLQGEWLALQSMLLSAQGKTADSRDLAEQALKILPENETQVRSITYMGLVDAYQQLLDYERAAETCKTIVQQARAAGDLASEVFGLSLLGRMVLLQGRLHLAYEITSQALQRIERTGSFSPFSATLYGELAQVHYYWHQLEEAREYFSRSVQWSSLGGFSDADIYHRVFLSRLFQMEGDLQASIQEIEKALELMQTAAPALVGEEVISQQVSIFLALDRLAAAQTALQAYGFTFKGEFSYPTLAPDAIIPHPMGLLYNSALRILLHQARAKRDQHALRRGIELADLVIKGSLRCRHLPIVLQTLLLRAQLYKALGDDQHGLADVAQVLELAGPEGFISIFIEEGAPMAEMLTTLLRRDLLGTDQPQYVQDILAAFPKTQTFKGMLGRQSAPSPRAVKDAIAINEFLAPVEPLTSRELEVLQHIAAGDSNQMIADKLVITLSAVKKHTGNIFNKLNVNSRTQALARARQLGLLSSDE